MNDAAIAPATETVTVEVYAENLPRLREQVEKLNGRIARLIKKGHTEFSPLILTEGESRQVKVHRQFVIEGAFGGHEVATSEFPSLLVKTTVTLSGAPSVVVAGWRFVAVVQHEEGGLVAAVPGAEGVDVSQYRGAKAKCDHCETVRTRKDTYILRNEASGEFKQVGSSCLKDFLGHDPFAAVTAAEHLAIIDNLCRDWDAEFERGGRQTIFAAEPFLAVVAATIREKGWLSRGKAREDGRDGEATADCAYGFLTNAPKSGGVPASADDLAYARKVLAWAQERFEGAR